MHITNWSHQIKDSYMIHMCIVQCRNTYVFSSTFYHSLVRSKFYNLATLIVIKKKNIKTKEKKEKRERGGMLAKFIGYI